MTDLRRHSRTLYDGLSRASARSYLLNIGFSREDLQKPIVGVNHVWISSLSQGAVDGFNAPLLLIQNEAD